MWSSTSFFTFTFFKLCSQHFITPLHYLYPPLLLQFCASFRRKTTFSKQNMMNKDFIMAEELENDMQDDEDEGFLDDEKKKKTYGRRGSGGGGSGGGGVSPPSCQVEKCGLDLSDAKRYHKRHKVCEMHAKAPFVVVAGLRQRFCQQCSRFQELPEFDESKRSCRRRLAGHNERRRKSSTETSSSSGAEGSGRGGMMMSNAQLKESHYLADDQMRARVPMAIHGSTTTSSFRRSQIR